MRLNEKPQMVADVRFLENDLKSAHISTLGRQMKIIIQVDVTEKFLSKLLFSLFNYKFIKCRAKMQGDLVPGAVHP